MAKYAKNGSNIGQGNMWFIEQYAEHLEKTYGHDVWEDGGLRKKCQEVVNNTLLGVQDMFEDHKTNGTTVELYGFDLMIDDECKPWLLEVNSAPTMEYSTSVTEHLCKTVMEDTIKVIVDYHFSKKKSQVDTGHWELIHQSKEVVGKPLSSFGVDFEVVGSKMKVKRQRKKDLSAPKPDIEEEVKQEKEEETIL